MNIKTLALIGLTTVSSSCATLSNKAARVLNHAPEAKVWQIPRPEIGETLKAYNLTRLDTGSVASVNITNFDGQNAAKVIMKPDTIPHRVDKSSQLISSKTYFTKGGDNYLTHIKDRFETFDDTVEYNLLTVDYENILMSKTHTQGIGEIMESPVFKQKNDISWSKYRNGDISLKQHFEELKALAKEQVKTAKSTEEFCHRTSCTEVPLTKEEFSTTKAEMLKPFSVEK